MMRLLGIIAAAVMFVSGCGSDGSDFDYTVPTQTYPIISRVAPSAVGAGDTVNIFGFGFSDVPQFNIVDINGVDVFADSYSLVNPPVAGEIEMLTFTVPAGIPAGTYTIFVTVVDNPSNTDLSITINP